MDLALDHVEFGEFGEFGNGGEDVHQFQAGESKPELHGQWDDFDSPERGGSGHRMLRTRG